jgi:hypothetical protein
MFGEFEDRRAFGDVVVDPGGQLRRRLAVRLDDELNAPACFVPIRCVENAPQGARDFKRGIFSPYFRNFLGCDCPAGSPIAAQGPS